MYLSCIAAQGLQKCGLKCQARSQAQEAGVHCTQAAKGDGDAQERGQAGCQVCLRSMHVLQLCIQFVQPLGMQIPRYAACRS